ncbi:MAG TPA: serine/threonine protein kinase, partial [Pseudomonas sp.]|nr:serine/threonine protein kinase [Pseudomonas sp.]
MRLADLTVAGREPACPALVELSGEASLHVDSWLRILPGQRYVGRARWNGRQVLAKLMVGGKAQRHYRRELAGAKLLTDQHLPTPALVGQGWQEGEGGWLLFDWLDSAKSLWESWRSVEAEPVLTDGQR